MFKQTPFDAQNIPMIRFSDYIEQLISPVKASAELIDF
jgi:hypothetical protein